ncbi:MAG: phosphoribosylformimino-5-aminoimidazole carboxamide ribotide isomerase [Nitrospirae bacterium]|nr:phosphoribosylformimino-5-aminoimidazole carboxamide ribotide isomerase [Nitrospirota bacterium]
MKFRPCIDIHNGVVKQIVGGTLDDSAAAGPVTNFTSDRPASYYATLYRRDGLTGGHVIKLGPGNDDAALDALGAWPGGLQIGGGIDDRNAAFWLNAGAEKVIVTSFVFSGGRIDMDRLKRLAGAVGRDRLVLDLSCRKRGGEYFIVTDRWQKFTEVSITAESLAFFAGYCSEFLIHAADVEGRCAGIEEPLVRFLGRHCHIPATYAGGIRSMDDIRLIDEAGTGRIDYTVGSALDIFGGIGVRYEELTGRKPD